MGNSYLIIIVVALLADAWLGQLLLDQDALSFWLTKSQYIWFIFFTFSMGIVVHIASTYGQWTSLIWGWLWLVSKLMSNMFVTKYDTVFRGNAAILFVGLYLIAAGTGRIVADLRRVPTSSTRTWWRWRICRGSSIGCCSNFASVVQ